MRNLKRALSLALAAMMLIGMMVVSAGAASKDFTDKDEIKNTEAVNTMVALNVISGKEDGSYFDPTGTLTRAEMAKIISFVMNGGVAPVLGTKVTPTYSDIKGHWAEAYIEYCTSMGIINGDGAGKFNPEGTLTASQAAKMFLTAMGYNANVFGFTGNSWETNTNRYANEAGLYDGLGGLSVSAPISRDDACQMAYNAIQGTMMRRTWSQDLETGKLTETYAPWLDGNNKPVTLLQQKFNAQVKYGYMTDVTYSSVKKEYTYNFSNTAAGAPTVANADYLANITCTDDYTSLMGMKTKMLYKTENSKTTVYGLYAVDAEKVVSAKGDDITIGADKVTISKVDYKTEGAVSVYAAGGYVGTLSAKNATYNYDLYDIDNDGKIELAVTVPYSVGKVTFKGNTSATIQVGASSSAYDLEDVTYYDGMAKDDFVVVVADTNTATDVTTISKLDVISGTVDATKGTSEYRIDGTWYKDVASASYIGGTPVTLAVGDQVEIAASNGFIFSATKVNGTSVDNILYVVASDSYDSSNPMDASNGNVIGATLGSYKGVDTRVMMPDGTDTIVKAMRVDVMQDLATDAAVKAFRAAPGLYTYTVNGDGVYELKAVKEATSAPANNDSKYYTAAAANKPSNTAVNNETSVFYVKGTGNTASTIDNKLIADDAVIYLVSTAGGTTKTKTVTGATLKTMANFGNATYDYITKTVNGMPTVIMAYLTDSGNAISGSSVDTAYGYVTSAGYYTKNGDNGVIKFTVWNGTEEVELTDVSTGLTTASAANAKYAKGAFVTYTTSSTAGEVTGVAALTDQFAITGYDNGYNINLKSAAGTAYSAKFKDDNKTVVIYVDTANGKGVEGGSIALAQEVSTGNYVMNAVAYSDGSWANGDEVSVLFVDIANKLDKAGYTVTTVTASANTIQGITLTPTVTTSAGALSSGNTVAAGSTITVTVTPAGTENTAVAYARTATVVMTRADGVTETKSVSFACDASTAINTTAKSVTFTMPDMGVTSIVVSFS